MSRNTVGVARGKNGFGRIMNLAEMCSLPAHGSLDSRLRRSSSRTPFSRPRYALRSLVEVSLRSPSHRSLRATRLVQILVYHTDAAGSSLRSSQSASEVGSGGFEPRGLRSARPLGVKSPSQTNLCLTTVFGTKLVGSGGFEPRPLRSLRSLVVYLKSASRKDSLVTSVPRRIYGFGRI